MFCNKCGAQLPDGTQFCSNCGAPQVPAQPEPQAQPQQPVYEAQQQPTYEMPQQPQQPYGAGNQPYQPVQPVMPPQNDDGKKKKAIIIAVVAVIAVIAIVVGILFGTGVIGGKDKEDEDDKTTVSDEKKDEQEEKDSTEPDTTPATSSTEPSSKADTTQQSGALNGSTVVFTLTTKFDDSRFSNIYPSNFTFYDDGTADFEGDSCTYIDDDTTLTIKADDGITIVYDITADTDAMTSTLKFNSGTVDGETYTIDQVEQGYGKTFPSATYSVTVK